MAKQKSIEAIIVKIDANAKIVNGLSPIPLASDEVDYRYSCAPTMTEAN